MANSGCLRGKNDKTRPPRCGLRPRGSDGVVVGLHCLSCMGHAAFGEGALLHVPTAHFHHVVHHDGGNDGSFCRAGDLDLRSSKPQAPRAGTPFCPNGNFPVGLPGGLGRLQRSGHGAAMASARDSSSYADDGERQSSFERRNAHGSRHFSVDTTEARLLTALPVASGLSAHQLAR
jgi:hypothetical protein